MSLSEIRKLEDSEYPLLLGVEEGYCPDPKSSLAVVAEEGGNIIGRMLLISPAHIEGTWVAEGYRKGTTGIRIMKFMEAEARKIGLTKLFSYAETPEIEDYLGRLDYKKCNVTVWAKEI